MDAEGNCKPVWLFLMPEHTATDMTTLPVPFITLQLRTAFTAKGIKWERSAVLYLLLCSQAAALQWKNCKWALRSQAEGQELPPCRASLSHHALLAHRLPPHQGGTREKGVSGATSLRGGIPCQTAVEVQASSY